MERNLTAGVATDCDRKHDRAVDCRSRAHSQLFCRGDFSKVAQAAERSWRRLRDHDELPRIILGVKLNYGVRSEAQTARSLGRPHPSMNLTRSVVRLKYFSWV